MKPIKPSLNYTNNNRLYNNHRDAPLYRYCLARLLLSWKVLLSIAIVVILSAQARSFTILQKMTNIETEDSQQDAPNGGDNNREDGVDKCNTTTDEKCINGKVAAIASALSTKQRMYPHNNNLPSSYNGRQSLLLFSQNYYDVPQHYSFEKSTQENYGVTNNKDFYGPFKDIRRSLDYDYHGKLILDLQKIPYAH